MKFLLKSYPFVDTKDIYDARKKQASVWGPYKSRVIGKKKYHLVHNRANLRRSSLGYLTCTSGIHAESRIPQERYWLILPLKGHVEVEINGNGFTADTTRAVLQAPWEDLKFRSTPTTQTFFYGIDMSLIHKSLPEGFRGRCGYVLEGPYRNVLKQTLIGFAESLDDWATGAVGAKRLPSFFNHLESTVAACLGDGIREWATGGYEGGRIGHMPIMTIRTFISDNLTSELTVGDIAEAAGVSVRTLQKGFVDHYFMSPKQMLKIMRLDKARELLKARRSPSQSVSEVCKAVGYGHAGRFSQEYAERFGESPSETLKPAKAFTH